MSGNVDRSRREFIKLSGAAVAAVTTSSMFYPSIAKALSIPANNVHGSIMDVEHIVVLMQENRSFDHYFGTLYGVRGFGDRHPVPTVNGSVWWQSFKSAEYSRLLTPYHLDSRIGNAQRVNGTPHLFNDAQFAWDNGKMDSWPTYKEQQSMGYYTEAEVPFQFALANAFTICDAYHCSFHGGTNPNRIFLWTGTNNHPDDTNPPAINNDFDSLGKSDQGYQWRTYPERLQAAGISWRLYQNLPDNFTDNPLAGFVNYRIANEQRGNLANGFPYPAWHPDDDFLNPLLKGVSNTMPDKGFLEALREDVIGGTLPQVSWIVAPADFSEHPGPSSPVQGGWYMQEVLDTLTANEEVWSKTVLIINFDENDGFFDHAPPPTPPTLLDGELLGGCTLDMSGEYHSDHRPYGPSPRVPALIISPWSRGGWVNSQVFDHTSVLRFIEARFGVREENISTYRRAICGDLSSAFNFNNPNDEQLPTLPRLTKAQAYDLVKQQQQLAQLIPPSEELQQVPRQTMGVRPSRALPYEVHVNAEQSAGRLTIKMSNSGAQGVLLHIYDKLRLDGIPRRYVLASEETMVDDWPVSSTEGYNIWLIGPNGYHRAFTGEGTEESKAHVSVCYDLTQPALLLTLTNLQDEVLTLTLDNTVYLGDLLLLELAPRQVLEQRIELAGQGNWYDVTVRYGERWQRRYAGRIETGQHAISDPIMGI